MSAQIGTLKVSGTQLCYRFIPDIGTGLVHSATKQSITFCPPYKPGRDTLCQFGGCRGEILMSCKISELHLKKMFL